MLTPAEEIRSLIEAIEPTKRDYLVGTTSLTEGILQDIGTNVKAFFSHSRDKANKVTIYTKFATRVIWRLGQAVLSLFQWAWQHKIQAAAIGAVAYDRNMALGAYTTITQVISGLADKTGDLGRALKAFNNFLQSPLLNAGEFARSMQELMKLPTMPGSLESAASLFQGDFWRPLLNLGLTWGLPISIFISIIGFAIGTKKTISDLMNTYETFSNELNKFKSNVNKQLTHEPNQQLDHKPVVREWQLIDKLKFIV